MRKFHDNFDYEEAEMDIWDAGGDPDSLDYKNPAKRDEYMKEVGLDPKNYGSKWGDFSNLDKSGNSGSGSSGCFLTSACVKAAGLADDCEELTALRWFRDHYMNHVPGGPDDIQEYYRIAPDIVSRIDCRDDADSIWNKIYKEFIQKCVGLIKDRKYDETYELYKNYTLMLQEQYLKAAALYEPEVHHLNAEETVLSFEVPGKIVAACGNDCAVCPRYTVHPYEKTDEELHHTAELWMKIGYRDHAVSNEEIACNGCKPENWCRYRVKECCEDRGIKTCGECTEYPCGNIKECFEVTKSFEPMCRQVCTCEEYFRMEKAFFEKEKNLAELLQRVDSTCAKRNVK